MFICGVDSVKDIFLILILILILIFDAFTLLIPEKTVANYALLRCKTFSLKIWVCKIFDKFHVCEPPPPLELISQH